MPARKIVIIGGGSFLWGPVLVRDFLVEPRLQGSELWLHDIVAEPLALVARYAERVRTAADRGWRVHTTAERGPALDGADAVVLCITTGGLEAMRHDLEIPLTYGIAQSVGDTVGPGGHMRALRNIPVVLDIAQDMERRCPDALLVNLTNPMTTLCRAVTKHTAIRTVGVCHEWPNTAIGLCMWLGLDTPAAVQATVAGINHLIWALDLRCGEEDGFARIRAEVERNDILPDAAVKLDQFAQTGYLPVAGDRHVAEFFPQYLTRETDFGAQFGVALTSIADREQWREEGMTEWEITGRRATIRAATTDEPVRLSPSIEDIAPIIADAFDAAGGRHIVNLPNTGQIHNLPRDAVVETYAHLSANGFAPDEIGDLPPPVQERLAPHVHNQERIVDAAVTGDRQLALAAFRDDPLVRDPDIGEPLFTAMLAATASWVPQFTP